MKKRFLSVIALMLMLALCLTACGGKGTETEGEGGEAAPLKVCYVSTSNRGDDIFVDMIYGALERVRDEQGIEIHIVEMDNDTSIYESTMLDVCDSGEYDLIVTGFFDMVDPSCVAAEQYPDQKILVFDTAMDYTDGKNANVVSVETLQNEGSFLAGALAAMMTTSDIEGCNPDKTIGYVAAFPGAGMDDWLTGYIDGAHWIDPETKIVYGYSSTFTDTSAAKEVALAQYQMGADVVFSVEDIAGIGVAEAAIEFNGYSIDCNSDLAMKIIGTNPEAANRIVTSMCKDFGTIIYDMVTDFALGELEFGVHHKYGLADRGVFLADNDIYRGIVTEEMLAKLAEAEEKILSGEIVVSTTIGVDQATYEALIARAQAN